MKVDIYHSEITKYLQTRKRDNPEQHPSFDLALNARHIRGPYLYYECRYNVHWTPQARQYEINKGPKHHVPGVMCCSLATGTV